MSSTLGCAQNSNGTLRDASEIQFYHDVDSAKPLPAASTSLSLTSRPLAPIFTTQRPLGKVAGSRRSPRRSSRQSKPSARVIDPNNAESSTLSSKRKSAEASTVPRKAPRLSKAAASDSETDGSDNDSDNESTDAPTEVEADDDEPQEVMDTEEYESIKAMADADHAHVGRPCCVINSPH
jgi:hypothetical protein